MVPRGSKEAHGPAAAAARNPHAPDTVYCPRNSAWCCCCISSSVPRQRWLARSMEEVCHSVHPHAPSSAHAAKNDPTERMRTLRWSCHGENSRLDVPARVASIQGPGQLGFEGGDRDVW